MGELYVRSFAPFLDGRHIIGRAQRHLCRLRPADRLP